MIRKNFFNKFEKRKVNSIYLDTKNFSYLIDNLDGVSNRLKVSKWKQKGIDSYDGTELKTYFKEALVNPDGKINTPTFLVFSNYEKILKWNRSLRFGISVCTLANMIKI